MGVGHDIVEYAHNTDTDDRAIGEICPAKLPNLSLEHKSFADQDTNEAKDVSKLLEFSSAELVDDLPVMGKVSSYFFV